MIDFHKTVIIAWQLQWQKRKLKYCCIVFLVRDVLHDRQQTTVNHRYHNNTSLVSGADQDDKFTDRTGA